MFFVSFHSVFACVGIYIFCLYFCNCKRFPLVPLGSTPLGCYKKLIEYYKNGEISFQYVKTFNMDEYVGKCF